MTKPDLYSLLFEERSYLITNYTNPLFINPDDYGIKAQLFSTSNHSGYDCSYKISGGQLLLDEFETYNEEGDYPPLNEAKPIIPKRKYDTCLWRNVNIKVDYTGVLMLADESSESDLCFVAVKDPFFSWSQVLGAAFYRGVLINKFDLSDVSKAMRSAYERANSEKERWEIYGKGTWNFDVMEFIHDERRSTVDAFYAPQFNREQEALLDAFLGRLELGQERKPEPHLGARISYVPEGCKSELISYDDLIAAIKRIESGLMVICDAELIGSYLLCLRDDNKPRHLEFEADDEYLHDAGFLISPKFDEELLEPSVSRNTIYRINPGRIERIYETIDKAYGKA